MVELARAKGYQICDENTQKLGNVYQSRPVVKRQYGRKDKQVMQNAKTKNVLKEKNLM